MQITKEEQKFYKKKFEENLKIFVTIQTDRQIQLEGKCSLVVGLYRNSFEDLFLIVKFKHIKKMFRI